MDTQNCPKCSTPLNPPLPSGRCVCKKCGWSDKPRKNLPLQVENPITDKTNQDESVNFAEESESASKKTVKTQKNLNLQFVGKPFKYINNLFDNIPGNLKLPVQVFTGILLAFSFLYLLNTVNKHMQFKSYMLELDKRISDSLKDASDYKILCDRGPAAIQKEGQKYRYKDPDTYKENLNKIYDEYKDYCNKSVTSLREASELMQKKASLLRN